MTAAALRPALFNNLIASRPDRANDNSLTATALSVLFHATLVVAAVWASVQLRGTAVPRTQEIVTPISIATTLPVEPAQQPQGGGGPPNINPSGPALTMPTFIPPDVPASSAGPDFATPLPGDNPAASNPGPTPGSSGIGSTTRDGFVVVSKMPAMLNVPEVTRALERAYPVMLRDAGIGGRAMVWVLLDEGGRVLRAEIKESTGHTALDAAALKVAPLMRFSPAMNRDQGVKVWVAVPVVFRTN